jgi:hypothetical protein
MQSSLVQGVEDIARATEVDYKRFSRGSVSTKELRSMGHPFGRTGGGMQRGQTQAGRVGRSGGQFTRRGVIKPLPINRQTGRLYAGIKMVRTGRHSWEIFSDAPYAKYIYAPEGTSRMVGRGFSGVSPSLAARLKVRATASMDGAVTKAWRSRNTAFLTYWRNRNKR